jgi:uncharacterized membrane protein (DUF106 family)
MIIIWNPHVTLILLGVGTGVAIHLFKLNAMNDEEMENAQILEKYVTKLEKSE